MNTPNTTDRLDAAERRLPPSLAAVTAERDALKAKCRQQRTELRRLNKTLQSMWEGVRFSHKVRRDMDAAAERDAALAALARIADMSQRWGDGTDLTGEMGNIAREALK